MTDLLDSFRAVRVLVVGDLMLDRYAQGNAHRISAEAPVPVVRLTRTWATPGGAGHVAACLAGLGCRVTVAGLVGADPAAEELRAALTKAGVAELMLSKVPNRRTVTKTRVVAGDFHQLLRLDDEPDPADWATEAAALADQVAALVGAADAIVLADYDKGTLRPAGIGRLISEAATAGRPVVVDPKKADLRVYAGATVLTPNVFETERVIGRRFRDEADLLATAVELRADYRLGSMLITRGPDGMTGADRDGVFHVPARVRGVADVTGAGDTVVAVLATALGAGADVRAGCELAAVAAGVAVTHPGTYVVTRDELWAAVGGHSPKVVDRAAAAGAVRRARAVGRTVVFTNGCFDLLHAGHLRTLQAARKHGDLLVVGMNSDSSVRALKGPSRPVNSQADRAALLAGLECVDLVVVFDEERPEAMVRELAPDVLVKGGDYRVEEIAGAAFVQSNGGRVVLIPLVPGLSSTRLIEQSSGG